MLSFRDVHKAIGKKVVTQKINLEVDKDEFSVLHLPLQSVAKQRYFL